MNDLHTRRYEALAETVVFAREPAVAVSHEVDTADRLALEQTAALAAAAFAGCAIVARQLQDRLGAAGLAFCAERHAHAPPPQPRAALPVTHRLRSRAAVVLGLAACAAFVFALWPSRSESVAAQRQALLAAEKDTMRVIWKGGPSPKSGTVRGEVVWSQSRQQGFLSFEGLPPLDAQHRFQLWIVDGSRDGAPVDGGLFVIADAGIETVVPVQARLPIGKAAAFVVTVEPKDGVVVSKQEHVVAIAGP